MARGRYRGFLGGPDPPSCSLLEDLDAVEAGRLWLNWDPEMERWSVQRLCRKGDVQDLFFLESAEELYEPPDRRIFDRLHLGDMAYHRLQDARRLREAKRKIKQDALAEVRGATREFVHDMLGRKSSVGPGGPVDGHKWESGDMLPTPPPSPRPTGRPGVRYPTIRVGPKG